MFILFAFVCVQVPRPNYEQFVEAFENGADPQLPRLYQGAPLTPIEMVWGWFREMIKRQDYHNSRGTHLVSALLEKKATLNVSAAAWSGSGRGKLPKLHEIWRYFTLPCVDVNFVRGGEVPLLTACRTLTNRVEMERVITLLITAKANLFAHSQPDAAGFAPHSHVTVFSELVRLLLCFVCSSVTIVCAGSRQRDSAASLAC